MSPNMMMMRTHEEQEAFNSHSRSTCKRCLCFLVFFTIYSAGFITIGAVKLSSGNELERETEGFDPWFDFQQLEENCNISQVVYGGAHERSCKNCECSDQYSFKFRVPPFVSADGTTIDKPEDYEYKSREIFVRRNGKSCGKSQQVSPPLEEGDTVFCWRPRSPRTNLPPIYKCGNEDCVKVVSPQYDIDEAIEEAEELKLDAVAPLINGIMAALWCVVLPIGCLSYVYRRWKSLERTDNSKSVLLSIDLDRPSGVYFPGEFVTGYVILKCTSHAAVCRSLAVGFACHACARFETGSGSDPTTHTRLDKSHLDSLTLRGNYCRTDKITTQTGHEASEEDLGIVKMSCTPSEARRLHLILRVVTVWNKCRGECIVDITALIEFNDKKSIPLTCNGKPCSIEITLSAEIVSLSSSNDEFYVLETQDTSCLALRFHSAKGLPKDCFFEVYEPAEVITDGKALPPPEYKTIYPPGTKIVAPFRFELRQDAPPSAELGKLHLAHCNSRNQTYIRYNIAASLDVPSDQRRSFCTRNITVLANRPLPPPALLCAHVKEGTALLETPNKKSKSVSIGDSAGNSAKIRLELERLAYAPGEVVNLERSSIFCKGTSGNVFAQVILTIHHELIAPSDKDGGTKKTFGWAEVRIGRKLTISPNRKTQVTGEFRIPATWKDLDGFQRAILPSFNLAEGMCTCIRWTYELGIRMSVDETKGFSTLASDRKEEASLSIPILISGAPPNLEALQSSVETPVQEVNFGPWDIFSHFDFDRLDPFETAPLRQTVDESLMLVPVRAPGRQLDHRESETLHQHVTASFRNTSDDPLGFDGILGGSERFQSTSFTIA